MSQSKDAKLGAQTALSPQARLGNTNAGRHHLYATRTGYQLRARRVRKLVQRLYELLPWLAESDRATARAWADLEHKIAAVSVDLDKNGLTNRQGEPRRLLGEYRGLLHLQLKYAEALGLTPTTRATLRKEVLQGNDLAAQAARLRGEFDG